MQNKRGVYYKAAQITNNAVTEADMKLINQYTLVPLEAHQVFSFKVSMCANDVDRDYEMFPVSTLATLSGLFIGKTVVKDHDHRSDNQIARIYATELINDSNRITQSDEAYTELIAKCYMIKTESNADLRAEINAGIRKEVSIGCRVAKAICSICGTDNKKQYCTHFPGEKYDGNLCYFKLEEAEDAYELSLVVVPSQKAGKTVKTYGSLPMYVNAKAAAAELTNKDGNKFTTPDELKKNDPSLKGKTGVVPNNPNSSSGTTPEPDTKGPIENEDQTTTATTKNKEDPMTFITELAGIVKGLAEKIDDLVSQKSKSNEPSKPENPSGNSPENTNNNQSDDDPPPASAEDKEKLAQAKIKELCFRLNLFQKNQSEEES